MAGTKKIGARIVIDGEAEFRSAINSSKNALKEFDSEMKLVTAQFKNNAQSMDALKSKQAVYQKQQQELTKQSKLLVEQIEKANKAYKTAEDEHTKQAESIKKLEKALEEAKAEYGDNSKEVEKLEKELDSANVAYAKQEKSLTNLSNQITKWNTDLNKTNASLVETDNALKETNDAIDNYDDNIKDADEETKKFAIVAKEAGEGTDSLRISLGNLVTAQVIVDVLRNCANAIKDVATSAIEVGMEFDASMSNVKALSGATGAELEALSNKAKEMGKSTIYSAKESADAFSYMSLAGWDTEQMLEGIEPVLQLAAAANMDLAQASDIVTDYITAFGLKASDAGRFADSMAYAMANSNTTVEMLGESYKNVAATAASMGVSFEDTTAVLMTMANAGVKGGEAGTTLNAIMTRLATNTKGCADELETYGIKVYDAKGNMNSLSSILEGLSGIWDTLSDKQQANLAKTIAGVSHYSQFQTVMQGVSEEAKIGGQSFFDYAEALRDCDGAAEAMAKTMQDNLTGDITILKSALEGLGIATEGVFNDAFREAVQGATDAVGEMERAVTSGELGVSLAEMGDALADLTESLVKTAEDGLPGFIDGITWLLNNLSNVGAGIETVAIGYGAYEVATLAATVATEGFTVAIEANPVGLLVGVLAAVTAGLYAFGKAADDAYAKQSGMSRETEHSVDASKRLNDSINDSISKRKQDVEAIDRQAQASHKLVEELFNANTTHERQAQIIGELKAIYPELNLSLSEQGRIVGATREELDRYIDSSLNMAKVEAAKEHLTEIAKQQFEAESELSKKADEIKSKTEDLAEAEREYNKEAQNHVDMNGNLVEVANEYSAKIESEKADLEALNEQYIETQKSVTDLGAEYNRTLEYIGNNAPIEDAISSTDELSESERRVLEITEEMEKEFQDLRDSIADSIGNSLDLTNKWSQEWGTSTSTMTSNIESQIDGIEKWADNFDTLANTAQVDIDQRVLKYLADMGTEGAGLVQQLVDTLEQSPEQLQDFSDKLAQYLMLEDSVSAEITDSYITCVTDGMTGAAEAVEEGAEPLKEAMQLVAESSMEGFTEVWGEDSEQFNQMGSGAMENTAKGVTEGGSQVESNMQKVADTAVKKFETSLGISGNTSTKFNSYGKTIVTSLGQGLSANADQLTSIADNIAKTTHDKFANILSEDAGKAIGNKFMDGIIKSVDAKGKELTEKAEAIGSKTKQALGGGSDDDKKKEGKSDSGMSMSGAEKTANNVSNSVSTYGQSKYSSETAVFADTVDKLANLIEAKTSNTTSETNISVELSGEVADIFNVVKVENDRIVKSKGYKPFA